jgi:hypothetical protein
MSVGSASGERLPKLRPDWEDEILRIGVVDDRAAGKPNMPLFLETIRPKRELRLEKQHV